MSTIIMSQCWPLEGMSITQKAVLMALAYLADDWAGACSPSVATLSRCVCASERAVQEALRHLGRSGAIVAKQRPGKLTLYTLTPGDYKGEGGA